MTSEAGPGATEPVARDAGPGETVPPSGDERVDAALAGLGGLASVPVSEHVAVFTGVQQGLQSVLSALDAENSENAENTESDESDGEAREESGRP